MILMGEKNILQWFRCLSLRISELSCSSIWLFIVFSKLTIELYLCIIFITYSDENVNQVYFYTTHQILDGVMRLEEVSLWQY